MNNPLLADGDVITALLKLNTQERRLLAQPYVVQIISDRDRFPMDKDYLEAVDDFYIAIGLREPKPDQQLLNAIKKDGLQPALVAAGLTVRQAVAVCDFCHECEIAAQSNSAFVGRRGLHDNDYVNS